MERERIINRIKRGRSSFNKSLQGTRNKIKPWFNKLLESLSNADAHKIELSIPEYTLLSLIHLINFEHMLKLIDAILANGAVIVLVCYTFVTFFVSMPIYMIFMFMASYSKKTYIVFWDCVPLMKGLGYVYAILSIPDTISNLNYAARCTNYAYQYLVITSGTMDSMCAENKYCLKEGMFTTFQETCYHNYTYPITVLFRIGNEESLLQNITSLKISKLILLILTFILVAKGLIRVRKLVKVLQITMVSFFISIFVITLLNTPNYRNKPLFMKSNYGQVIKVDFWLRLILDLSQMPEIGNLIWLSTFKPKPIRIDSFIIYIHFIKMMVVFCAVFWIALVYRTLSVTYNVNFENCVAIQGYQIALTAVANILTALPAGKLLIFVWYSAFAILQILISSFKIMSFVDSIVDAHRRLAKYRICLVLSCFLLFYILMWAIPAHLMIMAIQQWVLHGRSLIFTFMFCFTSIGINYIYSVDRLVNDFHFTYGDLPDHIWIVTWKAISVIAMLVLSYIIGWLYSQFHFILNNRNTQYILMSLILSFLVIIPCFIVFFSTCVKYVAQHSLLSATAPTENWGPYDLVTRGKRKDFRPNRDLKYRRLRVMCRHHQCLMHNEEWLKEAKLQDEKLQRTEYEMLKKYETTVGPMMIPSQLETMADTHEHRFTITPRECGYCTQPKQAPKCVMV